VPPPVARAHLAAVGAEPHHVLEDPAGRLHAGEEAGAAEHRVSAAEGGVGIGGVLEPVQAGPTIIGDNCFVGARSEVVEGVVVEDNCVISMGVYIGQSTKIYDRETGEVFYGRVPAGSVVVSGNLPSSDGKYSLYCAVIVKKVDEKTLSKVGINELLRGI